jgi:aspartate aminotransferase
MNIGVTMPKPEGGFYLFPNFNKWKDALVKKGIFTSKDFCNVLLKETGVALLPGEAFGHPKENFTARLTYVDFDGKELLNILKETPSVIVDGKFVEQYCPRMILGTKKIEQWILSL